MIYAVPYYSISDGGLQSMKVEAANRAEAEALATLHDYYGAAAGTASRLSEREYLDLTARDLQNIRDRSNALRAKLEAE